MDSNLQNSAERIQERFMEFASRKNLKLIHLIFIILVTLLLYSLISSDHSQLIRTFVVLGVLVFGFLDSWVIFFRLRTT